MTFRAGVVGVGMMGKHHARIYRELYSDGVDLVAIADTDSAAEGPANLYNVPFYRDFRTMLKTESLDVVSICTPTVQHFDGVIASLEAGVNVLVEKPICLDPQSAIAIDAKAQEMELICAVGHVERFNPAVKALKYLLPEIGAIHQISTRRKGPRPYRIRGTGVLLDLVPHDIDIMWYLLGQELVHVRSDLAMYSGEDRYEQAVIALLEFDAGTTGLIEADWITPIKIRDLMVTGEMGMFRLDYLNQELFHYELAVQGAQKDQWDALRVFTGDNRYEMHQVALNRQEPLKAEIRNFLLAVEGGPNETVTPHDGARVLRWIQKIHDGMHWGEDWKDARS